MESKQWAACGVVSTILLPIMASVIMLYSDVNTMKETKADTGDLSEIRLEYTKQMTKNTAAIENLSIIMADIKDFLRDKEYRLKE